MAVRFTRTALTEIDAIFSYLSQRNVAAATALIDRIDHSISNIEQFPALARLSNRAAVRIFPVRGTRYLVYYAIDKGDVVILHVRHGARRPLWDGT